MTDVSAGVAYGKVTGRFVAFEADGSDGSEIPDELPLEGSVTLTPVVNVVRWPTLTPPKIAVVRPIVCRIVNGDLLPPVGSTPGVTLVATDQPLAEPDTIQWTAKFVFTGAKQQPPEITFNVVANTTTDFSSIVPVPALTPIVHVVSTTDRVAAENAATAAQAAAASISGGVATAVADYLTAHPVGGATDMDGITDATAIGKTLVRAANAAAVKTALSIVATDVTDSTTIGRNILKAADAAAVKSLLSISLTAAGITDATTVGRNVLTAVDAAAARTAIGAVVLGTTSTTAKAGDYAPTAADISDSTAVGRNILKATDAAAAWTVIRTAAIGTTSTTAKAGDYQPTAANISDSTSLGRSLLTAGSQSAAITSLGTASKTYIDAQDKLSLQMLVYTGSAWPDRPTTDPAVSYGWLDSDGGASLPPDFIEGSDILFQPGVA